MEVLIAEDDRITRHKLKRFLENWGFDPVEADNGSDAMRIISGWKEPGIALLDWEMPGLKGIDICRKARADPGLKNTYFIMITSRSDPEDMVEGFESGADDYLSKPFDKEELRARIIAGKRIVDLERELELRALDAEKRYLDLFHTSTGGILQVDLPRDMDDLSGIAISAANPITCSILGYSREEIVELPLRDLVHQADLKRVHRILHDARSEGFEEGVLEMRMINKKGGIIWVFASYTDISGKQDELIRISFNFNDITEKKRTHLERMRKMLNYKLDEGNTYMVFESIPDTSITAFRELLSVGYHGTVITRRPSDEFSKYVKGDYDHFWVSDSKTEGSVPASGDAILKLMDNLPGKEIVFMDRIEYLISRTSFEEVLHLIQYLGETMIMNGSISILSVDPATLSDRERAYLKNECSEMIPVFKQNISRDLYDILKLIRNNSLKHIDTSLNNLESELGISRPTARKRINRLMDFEYIIETLKGREKTYHLTDKGRKMTSA